MMKSRRAKRWQKRYEFQQKMLASLTPEELEDYYAVCMGSEISPASFRAMRAYEAEMEIRTGLNMNDRPQL